jgi:hypothetical protein
MLTVAPIGNTNRVTRLSNFKFSSKHRNVTGNDAALIVFIKIQSKREEILLIFYLDPVPIPVSQA